MIEESEGMDAASVIDYKEKLELILPKDIKIGLLHGKMKGKEKDDIMDAFKNKEIDVLVSTTVIEVGIDVPNASVIMIESAERFGLSQLHQLRGRVGRGKEQSYAIFVSGSKSKKTMERLRVLERSNDGFNIAEEDLRLRGPGDLFGIRQSGILGFKIGDIYQDASILESASNYAEKIVKDGLNKHEIVKNTLEKKLSGSEFSLTL